MTAKRRFKRNRYRIDPTTAKNTKILHYVSQLRTDPNAQLAFETVNRLSNEAKGTTAFYTYNKLLWLIGWPHDRKPL